MYPYPLLNLDYCDNAVFIDDFTIDEDSSTLRILSKGGIKMKALPPELKYHANQGNVSFAVLFTSSMAYFETLKDVSIGQPIEIEIDKNDIAVRLDISILAYAKNETEINYSNIDSRFPSSMVLPKNSLIGELSSFRYWLAHERKRSVASILRLDLNAEQYSYELEMNKISIKIPKVVFESNQDIKGNGNLIFALYVYPVLVQAMSLVLEYRSDRRHSNLESLRWFEYIQMKIETTEINESNPIVACQDLIPINVQEEVIKMIYENSDE